MGLRARKGGGGVIPWPRRMAEERGRRRLEGLETTVPQPHGGEATGLDETRAGDAGRFVAPARGRRATDDLDAIAETQDASRDLGETRGPVRARGDAGERRAPVRSSAGDLGETRGPERAAAPGLGAETGETRVRGSLQFSDIERSGPSAALATVLASGRIGRFMVLRELGRGAMGVVFAAYDEELDRKVAIKLMHAGRGDDSSHGPRMLLREAQALARLAHPNVVAVHEVGMIEGAVFVAMEYVAGVDLQRWLGDARRPWREVVAVARQAGAGLLAAHQEGLVHRDFKPSNVLVGDDGRVRVADFGLAARRGASSGASATVPAGAAMTATLTGEGALIGTPVYMAPELLVGGSATAASDQYAFCVALWEALYGARPFDADTLAGLTDAVRKQALPAAPPRTDVPAWLHAAVARGLAKAPDQRYASLAELLELLGRDPEAERQQRRRRALQIAGAIAATAVIVALLVVAYGALRRYAAERQAEGRLAALREQLADLQARGEADEAGRLLQTFVALHGLITRLSAQAKVTEAAAALAVLARTAPDQAAAPALHGARLAAALARRDLAAAGVALAEADADGWAPVLADLSRTTDASGGPFVPSDVGRPTIPTLDFDGDGTAEMIHHRDGQLMVIRADTTLAVTRTLALAQPYEKLQAVEPAVAGEPLWLSTHPTGEPGQAEVRLCSVDADGAVRVLTRWQDSFVVNPVTVDLDGDGRRELYVGTEAYARKLWRLDRAADGAWTRRPAHNGTNAATSDVMGVTAADLDGDGRPELFATVDRVRRAGV
jgi:predicted Ser/Thr protein kinase